MRLSDRYGIPLVEDDPYGQLRYEGEHIKPLVVIDAELRHAEHDGCYSGNVIYLSTFSKTLAPGLRLGWVVAPRAVIERLVQAKQGIRPPHEHVRADARRRGHRPRRPGPERESVSASCIVGGGT